MLIHIPFQDIFRDQMLSGLITQITRMKCYGKPGDRFSAFGVEFELLDVYPCALRLIALERYQREGLEGVCSFEKFWAEMARRGCKKGDQVWVHKFNKVIKE